MTTFNPFLCLLWRGCRIIKELDTKVTNAAIFTINKEDHTLGNMIRKYVGQQARLITH